MLKELIIIAVWCYLSQLISYKIIKRIDKKQKIRLRNWENEYIKKLEEELKRIKEENKIEKEKEKETEEEKCIS